MILGDGFDVFNAMLTGVGRECLKGISRDAPEADLPPATDGLPPHPLLRRGSGRAGLLSTCARLSSTTNQRLHLPGVEIRQQGSSPSFSAVRGPPR